MAYLDEMNPAVRDYLLKKKQAQSQGPSGLEALSNAFASISSGLMGKDPVQAAQANQQMFNQQRQADLEGIKEDTMMELEGAKLQKQAKKDEQEELRIKNETDPASQESRLAQSLASKMVPGKDFSNLSAAQINQFLPSISKIYEGQQSALSRASASEDRKLARDEKKAEKLAASEEKKKTILTEIEDRRTNIKDNLKLLKDQISKYGTYEAFGPQNADMERRVDQIATDMAKLTDPNSVARPSEVDMFKKGLVAPTIGQKNSTALSILDSFEKEVDQRAANAYRLRGLENPQGEKTPNQPMLDPDARKKRIQELKAKLGK